MEYLGGGTLEQVLRQGAQPPARALVWIEQVASALDAAHARGIVHRDVKPANLLLDEHSRVRVADFGIATAAGLDSLTLTGTILGTAGYLAPEQALGQTVTPAADRYALGVVAFELLTGNAAVPARLGDGRGRRPCLRTGALGSRAEPGAPDGARHSLRPCARQGPGRAIPELRCARGSPARRLGAGDGRRHAPAAARAPTRPTAQGGAAPEPQAGPARRRGAHRTRRGRGARDLLADNRRPVRRQAAARHPDRHHAGEGAHDNRDDAAPHDRPAHRGRLRPTSTRAVTG